MSVDQFSSLRDCTVFREFDWPKDLPDFGRYNLIYGWNGSGKTTLSRVLRDLELRRPPTHERVRLSVNGAALDGDDFGEAQIHVRVFNRDYVTENVFPVNEGDLHPIFVLGRESVETQKEIETLKTDRDQEHTKLESARKAKSDSKTSLDQFSMRQAKTIKETLTASDSNYNNYDKSDFHTMAKKQEQSGDWADHHLAESDREKLLVQIRATPKGKLRTVSYRTPPLKQRIHDVNKLLSATVVATTIGSLENDAVLSDWLHTGVGLHQSRDAQSCLYCEQEIPNHRVTALEAHFSSEYENLLNRIDAEIAQLEAESREAAELRLPTRAELHDDLAPSYQIAATEVQKTCDSTKKYLDSLVSALTQKRTKMFSRVENKIAAPDVKASAVDELNKIVKQHNKARENFAERLANARQRLESHLVADALDEMIEHERKVKESIGNFDSAKSETGRLDNKIEQLERDIVDHHQPADELNDDLRKYLGYDELRLEFKDTGYSITRHGVPAKSLSEGETTAVALLYFLKSLEDHRFPFADGVIVLDDPVSSLDANALYLAFGLIRERTEDAAQVIIFTHNFTFFRQVRNWFHNMKGQHKSDVKQRPARLYMLDCTHKDGRRCARVQPLDPLLENYETEYHFLFARIYREANSTGEERLEEHYVFPNMARRLLETFLAFRQPQAEGLWSKLDVVKFDEAKKLRIIRFLDTHSHADSIGEPEHDLSGLSEARSVLKNLLELVEAEDPDHFKAMVKLVASTAREGQAE